MSKTNSVAFSPQANYTDCATATCRRNVLPTVEKIGELGTPLAVTSNRRTLRRNTVYVCIRKLSVSPALVARDSEKGKRVLRRFSAFEQPKFSCRSQIERGTHPVLCALHLVRLTAHGQVDLRSRFSRHISPCSDIQSWSQVQLPTAR
jgi:hypothetical protein